MEEATSGVRVVMRDNVSADEPTRTSTRWGGGEALDGGAGRNRPENWAARNPSTRLVIDRG